MMHNAYHTVVWVVVVVVVVTALLVGGWVFVVWVVGPAAAPVLAVVLAVGLVVVWLLPFLNYLEAFALLGDTRPGQCPVCPVGLPEHLPNILASLFLPIETVALDLALRSLGLA